jgi:hypothetical protein
MVGVRVSSSRRCRSRRISDVKWRRDVKTITIDGTLLPNVHAHWPIHRVVVVTVVNASGLCSRQRPCRNQRRDGQHVYEFPCLWCRWESAIDRSRPERELLEHLLEIPSLAAESNLTPHHRLQ